MGMYMSRTSKTQSKASCSHPVAAGFLPCTLPDTYICMYDLGVKVSKSVYDPMIDDPHDNSAL